MHKANNFFFSLKIYFFAVESKSDIFLRTQDNLTNRQREASSVKVNENAGDH